MGSALHKVSNASRHGGPGISLRCKRSATAHSSISKAARIGTSAPFDVFAVFFRCVSKDARDVIVSSAGSSVIAAVARESWCMGISINSDRSPKPPLSSPLRTRAGPTRSPGRRPAHRPPALCARTRLAGSAYTQLRQQFPGPAWLSFGQPARRLGGRS